MYLTIPSQSRIFKEELLQFSFSLRFLLANMRFQVAVSGSASADSRAARLNPRSDVRPTSATPRPSAQISRSFAVSRHQTDPPLTSRRSRIRPNPHDLAIAIPAFSPAATAAFLTAPRRRFASRVVDAPFPTKECNKKTVNISRRGYSIRFDDFFLLAAAKRIPKIIEGKKKEERGEVTGGG